MLGGGTSGQLTGKGGDEDVMEVIVRSDLVHGPGVALDRDGGLTLHQQPRLGRGHTVTHHPQHISGFSRARGQHSEASLGEGGVNLDWPLGRGRGGEAWGQPHMQQSQGAGRGAGTAVTIKFSKTLK